MGGFGTQRNGSVAYCARKKQSRRISDTSGVACRARKKQSRRTSDMYGAACRARKNQGGCTADMFGVASCAHKSLIRHMADNTGAPSHVDIYGECIASQGALVALLQLSKFPCDHSGARSTFDISCEL